MRRAEILLSLIFFGKVLFDFDQVFLCLGFAAFRQFARVGVGGGELLLLAREFDRHGAIELAGIRAGVLIQNLEAVMYQVAADILGMRLRLKYQPFGGILEPISS